MAEVVVHLTCSVNKEDRKMLVNPIIVREYHNLRCNEVLQKAQERRLLKEARGDRPSPYASILSRVGGILITVGRSLEAQYPSSITCQTQQ
jgi:hypothetical protein